MQAQPELHCPVCGAPNECAAAASGSFATPCWCADVIVDPTALARVPVGQRNRACLCRNCLAHGVPGPQAEGFASRRRDR